MTMVGRHRILVVLLVAWAGCGNDVPRRGERDSGARPDSGPPPSRDAGSDAGPSADDPATLARAAVVMSSCIGGSAGVLLFQAYGSAAPPSYLSSLLREHAVCLATEGTGCEAIDTCLGIELDVSGECTPGCEGDTAVLCGAGHVRWDCADVGLAWVDGTCVADDDTCTESACDGDRPLVCTDGVPERGPDCAAYGLSCAPPAAGDPGCTGGGEACEAMVAATTTIEWFEDSIECVDRETLASCVNGGTHEIACADIARGMTCRTTSAVEMRAYCGLANECDPFTTVVEFCSGDDVPVCNAGRLDRVSCFDLGFTRCASGHCE